MAYAIAVGEWGKKPKAERNAADHSAAHTALCKQVEQYLAGVGAWYANIAGSKYQRAGLPDYLCFIWHPGLKMPIFFACEVKTGTGRLSGEQKTIQTEIAQQKGLYCVARSLDDLHDFLYERGLVLQLLLR